MKKIMFNDRYGLTQAVLEGRKTQTRRIAFKRDMEPPLQGITPEYIILVRSWYKLGETIAIAQSYKTIQEYLRKATGTDLELKPARIHTSAIPTRCSSFTPTVKPTHGNPPQKTSSPKIGNW